MPPVAATFARSADVAPRGTSGRKGGPLAVRKTFALGAISVWLAAGLWAQDIDFDKGSGTIVEGGTSPDGMFAVVVTENREENVVVFLPERRQVLKLSGDGINGASFPYFPGLNHAALTVLWGPNQEGNSFGVLFYDAKWESAGIVLIDVNPDFGRQAPILPMLLAAARSAAGPDLAYSFSPAGLEDPAGEFSITDPIDVRINYLGQSPGNEQTPDENDTLRVRLIRTEGGPVAILPDDEAGTTASAGAPSDVPTAEDFLNLRDAINDDIKSGDFREVKLHRRGRDGRSLSYLGYLQGTVLAKLVHVDSRDDENETLTLYYWRDGQLVSVFEVREGADTQISDVGKTVEIYNFEMEKLVGWIRDGVEVQPGDPTFADAGALVLRQSRERAEPVYEEIGAD